MIEGYNPVVQALLGTLFTWGVTALGSSLVFFIKVDKIVLDASLGFAAGVMLAATYWSLLNPAVEAASLLPEYGKNGQYAFIPVALGFALGAMFVLVVDYLIPEKYYQQARDSASSISAPTYALSAPAHISSGPISSRISAVVNDAAAQARPSFDKDSPRKFHLNLRRRTLTTEDKVSEFKKRTIDSLEDLFEEETLDDGSRVEDQGDLTWRRLLMLIVAITLHNIPEGMAVGVGFASIGKTRSSSFAKARNLAIGIAIQNFPEGLAVSLPLHASGMSAFRSFWYGQLSGMVEPIAGIIGAYTVILVEPILPMILSFAAGAMIYVILDDIIPESHNGPNGKLSSFFAIVGFIIMMCLDVGLE